MKKQKQTDGHQVAPVDLTAPLQVKKYISEENESERTGEKYSPHPIVRVSRRGGTGSPSRIVNINATDFSHILAGLRQL